MKGPGSPNWRKAGRPAKGEMAVKAKPLYDLSEDAGAPIGQLVESSAHEAIRHLRWQMRHAPSIRAKERAARKLAELGTPKPPTRIEQSGPGGGPVQSEHVIRFVDPPER